MDETATSQSIKQARKDLERQRLESMVQHFIAKYAPLDRQEHAEFTSEFVFLVHQIHHSAAEPFYEVIGRAISLTPFPTTDRK